MRNRKPPLRMCVGCREQKNKRELIRVVRTPEGEVTIDHTGKRAGRGAYLCFRNECFKKAIKSRTLERSLSVKLNEETIATLEEHLTNNEEFKK